jgi:ribosome-binding protein aMBF1 (putative translation factor)
MAKATTISIKNFLKTTIHPRLQDGVFWLVFIKASKYPSNNFAESIRKYRLLQGLSQKELGEKLGVSETTIYN